MNWKITSLIVLLFLATLIPMGYKSLVLGVDIFPKLKKDIWELEVKVQIAGGVTGETMEFPVVEPTDRVKVLGTKFQGEGLSLHVEKTKEGSFGLLNKISPQPTQAYYRILLQTKSKEFKIPKQDFTTSYKKPVAAFLTPIPVSESLDQLLNTLQRDLSLKNSDKVSDAKRIFYFVNEEILNSDTTVGIEQALLNYRGSNQDKANLLTVLLRRRGIPARTIAGIRLVDKKDIKRPIQYWNEVYLGKQWIPLSPYRAYFGKIPASYVPLFTSVELEKGFPEQQGKFSIYARRMLSDQFNALQYRSELVKKDSRFLNFSPYVLPLSQQPAMKVLLLFTFGCVVLALCRNIIGIKTFGIFFPILLSLFLKETSLVFGMVFLFLLLLAGYGERHLLKDLHLLAVPRFSVILTLIVMTLLIFAILNSYYHFSENNPAVLPIIIITMFIERFSISLEEEGAWNTAKSLVGSIVVALFSYAIFSWHSAELLLYSNPEILFSVVAVLILIGRYTGYRLSELIRFREFLQKRKSYQS